MTTIRKAVRSFAMLGLLAGAVAVSGCSISLGGHSHPGYHGGGRGGPGGKGGCPHCAAMKEKGHMGHEGHMGHHEGEGGGPASQPSE